MARGMDSTQPSERDGSSFGPRRSFFWAETAGKWACSKRRSKTRRATPKKNGLSSSSQFGCERRCLLACPHSLLLWRLRLQLPSRIMMPSRPAHQMDIARGWRCQGDMRWTTSTRAVALVILGSIAAEVCCGGAVLAHAMSPAALRLGLSPAPAALDYSASCFFSLHLGPLRLDYGCCSGLWQWPQPSRISF